ncbi:MAG TPA: RidA family protein [Devosiaceae bacterium]
MSIERIGAIPGASTGDKPPYAKVVRAGDFYFVSGQVPADANGALVGGGIAEQTRQAIRNLEAALKLVDLGLPDVVKVTAWLDDPRDFGAFNKVYAEFFGAALPARSCVRAEMMVDCKVEIEAVAYSPATA